jgi:hypothetical protein
MKALGERMRPDGTVAIFHFVDGWILRRTIDARDMLRAGQAAEVPDEARFRAFVAAHPDGFAWPSEIPTPPWFVKLANELSVPPNGLDAESDTDSADA